MYRHIKHRLKAFFKLPPCECFLTTLLLCFIVLIIFGIPIIICIIFGMILKSFGFLLDESPFDVFFFGFMAACLFFMAIYGIYKIISFFKDHWLAIKNYFPNLKKEYHKNLALEEANY